MTQSRLRREIERARARFRHVSLGDALANYIRALKLHMMPAPAAVLPNGPEVAIGVVVTLTTTPARARYLAPTLRSLLDQDLKAERIVLALPRVSARDGTPYPAPAELGLPEGIEVLPCKDIGPATKLLPALLAAPEAVLLVVDDDVVYPRDFIRTLLSAHQHMPGTVIGYRGVCLEDGVRFGDLPHVFASAQAVPRAVDILFGTWGYLVPPGALDAAVHDFSAAPAGVRNVDDVWISGHLARRGVKRCVIPASSFPIETLAALRGALTGGINRSGENDALAIHFFADAWGEGNGKKEASS